MATAEPAKWCKEHTCMHTCARVQIAKGKNLSKINLCWEEKTTLQANVQPNIIILSAIQLASSSSYSLFNSVHLDKLLYQLTQALITTQNCTQQKLLPFWTFAGRNGRTVARVTIPSSASTLKPTNGQFKLDQTSPCQSNNFFSKTAITMAGSLPFLTVATVHLCTTAACAHPSY